MKRFASGLLALALTVMPAVAFAEGNDTDTTTTPGSTTDQPTTTNPDQGTTTPDQNQNDDQTQTPGQDTTTQPGSGDQNGGQTQDPNQGGTTQPGSGEQKQEVEIVVDSKLLDLGEAEGEEGYYGLGYHAELKDVSKASGTWTVEVVGGMKNEFKGGKELEKSISLGAGKHFTVNFQFTGTADGKEVTGKKTVEVNVPDFKVEYKADGGKHVLSGKIDNIRNAKGNWYFGVAYVDSEDALDEKIYNDVEGLSLSHSFNLKPGEYVGVVAFEGYVDGVYTVLYDLVEFEVTADGKGEVKEPSDDGDKSPVVDPDKGKKILDDAKKGGKLPKTATTYPTGAVAGLVLLAGGLALLKVRRTA